MNKDKLTPITDFYRSVVFADKVFDVNFQEIAKVLFTEVDRLNELINKAIDYINDEEKSNNSNWLCQGREDLLDILKGVDKE